MNAFNPFQPCISYLRRSVVLLLPFVCNNSCALGLSKVASCNYKNHPTDLLQGHVGVATRPSLVVKYFCHVTMTASERSVMILFSIHTINFVSITRRGNTETGNATVIIPLRVLQFGPYQVPHGMQTLSQDKVSYGMWLCGHCPVVRFAFNPSQL